jgi:hypothetical protein
MQGESSLLPADRAASVTVATDDHDCLTYTVTQAARLAGVSISYYYRAAHQGLVPAKFLGRRSWCPRRPSTGSSGTLRLPQVGMRPRECPGVQAVSALRPGQVGR